MAVSSQMEVLNTGSTVESPKELQSVKSGSGVGFGHVDLCSGSGDSSRAGGPPVTVLPPEPRNMPGLLRTGHGLPKVSMDPKG